MSKELQKLLFKPNDLKEFAKEELDLDLSDDEARSLTKVYCMTIRGYLAARVRLHNQPPFVVRDWRDLSTMRRRLFGLAHKTRAGLSCGLREIIINGVVAAVGIYHDIKLDEHDGRSIEYRRFIFLNPKLWQTKTAKVVLGKDEVDVVLRKLVAAYVAYTTETAASDNELRMTIDLSRLRSMIPSSKAKQKQQFVRLVDSEWPLAGSGPDRKFLSVRGEDIAHVSSLFGDTGTLTAVRVPFSYLHFFNEWVRIVYELRR